MQRVGGAGACVAGPTGGRADEHAPFPVALQTQPRTRRRFSLPHLTTEASSWVWAGRLQPASMAVTPGSKGSSTENARSRAQAPRFWPVAVGPVGRQAGRQAGSVQSEGTLRAGAVRGVPEGTGWQWPDPIRACTGTIAAPHLRRWQAPPTSAVRPAAQPCPQSSGT